MYGVTKKDEEAEVDVWSHEERYGQTCERISESGIGVKEDRGEKTEVVRWCWEKGQRARAKKDDRYTDTEKETERQTENEVERLL